MTAPAQALLDSIAQLGGPFRYNNGNVPGPVLQPDLKKHLFHLYTLTGNVTVTEPLFPPPPGVEFTLTLVQDATGGRTVNWASCFRDPPNWSGGGAAASATASARFFFDGGSYQCVWSSSAFALAGTSLNLPTGSISLLSDAPRVKPNPQPTAGSLTIGGVAPGFQRNTIVTRGPLVGTMTFAGVAFNIPASIIVPCGGAITQTPTVAVVGVAPVVTHT